MAESLGKTIRFFLGYRDRQVIKSNQATTNPPIQGAERKCKSKSQQTEHHCRQIQEEQPVNCDKRHIPGLEMQKNGVNGKQCVVIQALSATPDFAAKPDTFFSAHFSHISVERGKRQGMCALRHRFFGNFATAVWYYQAALNFVVFLISFCCWRAWRATEVL